MAQRFDFRHDDQPETDRRGSRGNPARACGDLTGMRTSPAQAQGYAGPGRPGFYSCLPPSLLRK